MTCNLTSLFGARVLCNVQPQVTRRGDVESELASMKAEHDTLASHIFVSRRHYRNVNEMKSGKRRDVNARLSFDTACKLGFRGSLDEWERLMGAVARR